MRRIVKKQDLNSVSFWQGHDANHLYDGVETINTGTDCICDEGEKKPSANTLHTHASTNAHDVFYILAEKL